MATGFSRRHIGTLPLAYLCGVVHKMPYIETIHAGIQGVTVLSHRGQFTLAQGEHGRPWRSVLEQAKILLYGETDVMGLIIWMFPRWKCAF
ncbi:MAG: hypothetical protein ACU88J_10705 [Gammaproteobacteria bacterium]